MAVSDIFGAVANPVRRRILNLLRERPRAAGDIARSFELQRPAVSEHLQVLRNVGLVSEQVEGRRRIYHLNPEPLEEVREWLNPFESYWRERLEALKNLLNSEDL